MNESKRQLLAALRKKRVINPFGRTLPPKRMERAYQRDLLRMVNTYRQAVRQVLFPQLPKILAEAYQYRPTEKMDSAGDAAKKAKELLRLAKSTASQSYSEEEIKSIAKRKGQEIADFNEEVFQRNLKRVAGADIFLDQPWLAGEITLFTEQNVSLITSIPEAAFSQVESIVNQAIQRGLRAEDIEDDIEARFDVSESRAKLIARDQVNKLNSQLTQLRQTDLGIEKYIWRTSLDERVRDSHAAKEGNVYRWDDPPNDTGHPGEDFQCRCTAEPVLDDLLADE